MVPIVNSLVRPKSVLDVGCGVGTWLAEWTCQGVSDIHGLDGDYIDGALLQIHPSSFQAADLRTPFSLGRRFDLVQSLEVAEHLDESCADTFVQSLAAHADIVLFSAAIPGQGGTHHVNEQWPSYWYEKFLSLGFQLYDIVRPAIWSNQRISWWYRQNAMIFSKSLTFEPVQACIDVVHPECLHANQNRILPLRHLVAELPAAVKSAVRNRIPV
jgi:hypothetical protein